MKHSMEITEKSYFGYKKYEIPYKYITSRYNSNGISAAVMGNGLSRF